MNFLSIRLHLASATALAATAGLALAGPAHAAPAVNGSIAYTTESTDDLFTVNGDGVNNTRLIETKQLEGDPQYSLDGSQIAYVRFPSLKPDDLYVSDADGTGTTRLTSSKKPIDAPVWSADGSRILFLTERDNDFDGAEIYSIAPDGSDETLLATDARSLSDGATLSTAAGKIAYANGDADVVAMNLDGSEKTVLAAHPGRDLNPQLSPDASTIAFESERGAGDVLDVFRISIDGTGVTQLTNGGAALAGFSPDGLRLAFTDLDGFTRAKVMNADGTDVVTLSPEKLNFSAEEFSPDSTTVSLSQTLPLPGEDPFYRLYTTLVDKPELKAITTRKDGAIYGDWQPLSAPAEAPPLTLDVELAPRVKGKAPTLRVTCSNECDVGSKGEGTFGVREHIYGGVTTDIPAFGRRALRTATRAGTAERAGAILLSVNAFDDFGQRAKVNIRVKPGR